MRCVTHLISALSETAGHSREFRGGVVYRVEGTGYILSNVSPGTWLGSAKLRMLMNAELSAAVL